MRRKVRLLAAGASIVFSLAMGGPARAATAAQPSSAAQLAITIAGDGLNPSRSSAWRTCRWSGCWPKPTM